MEKTAIMHTSAVMQKATPAMIGAGVLVGLYVIAGSNYLVFHALVELFSVAVAWGIAMLAWNARKFARNDYLMFLGIAYAFVAGVDLLHTLAYKGMGVFATPGSNLATQLWMAARAIESLSLLLAPIFLTRRLKPAATFAVYAVIVAALFVSVFRPTGWFAFPTCYNDIAERLTAFKKTSEYVLCGILAASLAFLLVKRRAMAPGLLGFIIASVAVTIASELAFTFYVSVFDFSNLVGHLLKLASFYLIYKAIIESGLTRPYRTMFRDLTESELALRKAGDELEQRVQQRTEQVRELAAELTRIEHRERRRLTQVLHDGVQPLLVAARMHVGALRQRLADPADRRPLDQVFGLLAESLEATRSVAMELSPPVLHDGGLAPALDWLAHRMGDHHGLAVAVQADAAAEPASEHVRILLFEATRELLLNVVKHAGADAANVRMRRTNGVVEILVHDDGRGFTMADGSSPDTPTGTGLINIRNRLELVGGRLQVDTAPGEGTRARLQAPAGG